jgi:hypothetical protein
VAAPAELALVVLDTADVVIVVGSSAVPVFLCSIGNLLNRSRMLRKNRQFLIMSKRAVLAVEHGSQTPKCLKKIARLFWNLSSVRGFRIASKNSVNGSSSSSDSIVSSR